MFCKIHFALPLLHMSEKRWQFIIISLVFILQYLFEHFFPQEKKYNNAKRELENMLIGILNILILFIPSILIVELLDLTQKFQLGLFYLLRLPPVINIILTFMIMDLAMYFWHRFNHTKAILWRFHKFHHLDTNLNTTTAFRFHIIELLLSLFFKSLLFLLMGFSFMPVLVYETLFFAAVVIQHSNIQISVRFDMVYRKIFSSPLMHRVHHSNTREETDTNYGSVFSFWDKAFSTYKKEAPREIIFGVDERKG